MEQSREPPIRYYKYFTITRIDENVVSLAERNRPLGIFMDKESEFLSFPTIYCGQTRADNKERTIPVSGLGETILSFFRPECPL